MNNNRSVNCGCGRNTEIKNNQITIKNRKLFVYNTNFSCCGFETCFTYNRVQSTDVMNTNSLF